MIFGFILLAHNRTFSWKVRVEEQQKIKKLKSSYRSASRLEEERLKAVQELEEVKITFISKVFLSVHLPLELPAMIQGASVKSFERQPMFSDVLSPHLGGCLEWI